jgi:hypothetical protein
MTDKPLHQPSSSESGSGKTAFREAAIAADAAVELRRLSHDLSNSLEVVLQTSYLLGMSGVGGEDSLKWREMLDQSVQQAARLNREIRDYIRSNS